MAILSETPTLDEFLALPEEEPALEYEDGRITQKVSPQGRHSTLQIGFGALINQFARPRKLAFAFSELRSSYAGLSRVPDISVYRWERIPRDDSGEVADVFREPPDIAIEIVSPGQSANGLVRRCLRFVVAGVPIALLLDPSDKSVLLFRPNRPMLDLAGTDVVDLTDVIPGFSITADEIFATLVFA